MCGRYFLTTPGDVLAARLGLEAVPELAPRYNIAPSQEVPIVRAVEGGRELVQVRWGLVPFWAKEAAIGNRLINARAESLSEKPSFRDSFKKRRCLIPADGFYEWRKIAGGKQPYVLRLRDRRPFVFAGLWSRWQDPGTGDPLESCAIVTTSANALAATIHDRMPVILPDSAHQAWLDAGQRDAAALSPLLVEYPADEMEAFPVSRHVNRPGNDDPKCLEPVPALGG